MFQLQQKIILKHEQKIKSKPIQQIKYFIDSTHA